MITMTHLSVIMRTHLSLRRWHPGCNNYHSKCPSSGLLPIMYLFSSDCAYLLCPGRGAGVLWSVFAACMCLSVHEHIRGIAEPVFTKFCVQIPCGRGSVVLWRRCATLCGSSFMNNTTFGRNGQCGDALQYRGRVWCLWMRSFDLYLMTVTLVTHFRFLKAIVHWFVRHFCYREKHACHLTLWYCKHCQSLSVPPSISIT